MQLPPGNHWFARTPATSSPAETPADCVFASFDTLPDRHGYRVMYVPNHPTRFGKKCHTMYQHRYLMELKLGRFLESDEVVHHRDGNRSNNSLDNLELVNRREHMDRHAQIYAIKRCPHCSREAKLRVTLDGEMCHQCYLRWRYAHGQDRGRKVVCVKCGEERGCRSVDSDGICGRCRER